MNPSLTFIYYIAFSIYLFIGLIVLELKKPKRVNNMFFLVCLSLSIWVFSYLMSMTAKTEVSALIWRRITAIGWTTVYAFVLHFILELTGLISNYKISYYKVMLLYIPAIVCVVYYIILPNSITDTYTMKLGVFGWQNVSDNNAFDYFFYFYYISYTLASIISIVVWSKIDRNRRSVAIKILTSMFLVFVIGTLIDVFMASSMPQDTLKITSLLGVLPTMVIFYLALKHSFMEISTSLTDELIVDQSIINMLMNVLSLSLLSGACFNLFMVDRFNPVRLVISGFLITLAIAFQLVSRMGFSNQVKSYFSMIVVYLMIPSASIYTLSRAGITTWSGPLIIIILFTVFNSRKVIVFLTVGVMAAQIITWTYAAELTVEVSHMDHLLRIGMYGFIIYLTLYVNRLYINVIKRRSHQLNEQSLINAISTEFLTIDFDNQKEKYNKALSLIGEFYDLNRVNLGFMNYEERSIVLDYEWVSEDKYKSDYNSVSLNFDDIGKWLSSLRNNEYFNISSVNVNLIESNQLKDIFIDKSTKSYAAVPINSSGLTSGFIGLETVDHISAFEEESFKSLVTISNIFADATVKLKAEFNQHKMAYYDELTDLPNRFYYNEVLNSFLEEARPFSIYFLDLDGFKSINDSKGHDEGDFILIEVGRRLKEALGEIFIARFGGDEFLIIDTGIDDRALDSVVSIIDDCFKKPFYVENHYYHITSSTGIARYPVDGGDANALIKNADLAMFSAKEQSNNSYFVCNEALKNSIEKEMNLTSAIREAIENEDFYLVYQPQVRMSDQKIVGTEALLRWHSKDHGNLSPGVFIPIIEKNNLITQIGDFVLDEAIKACKSWHDYAKINVSVNIAVDQLKENRFVEKVKNLLQQYDLEGHYLDIEITESAIIEDFEAIRDTLNQLKTLGVTISIDDFGTGYSSMTRLKELPIDRLKMDISFVREIESSKKDQAIARTIIELAKQLEMKSLAEGVEEEVQKKLLSEMNCDEAQGYGYYRPMRYDDIISILSKK